ncbi:hypothetical protein XELAEV_18038306mg [Xenopus laevis]|uniref:Sulfhydryl oxidase n=1 Tax=Xenopus laevis TaxID=8355 RepID=A0A974H6R9_XENLA|nr:hypothetical protein XELAEV_18038306mg [Xenopus laevis]
MAALVGQPLRSPVLMMMMMVVLLGAGMARGETLYGPGDSVSILNKESVARAVFNSSSAWLLEFYSSCVILFAFLLTDWEPAIKIGVLDCAEEDNYGTCKDFGVPLYPTFRFFTAFTKEFTQGENYKAGGDRDIQTVRQAIIDFLQTSPAESKPQAYSSLEPISSSEISSLLTQKQSHYTAIIFESEESYEGREVILDLIQYSNIVVRRALPSDKAILEKLGIGSVPSCYLIQPNGSHGLINDVKSVRSQLSSHLKALRGVRKRLPSETAHSGLSKGSQQEDAAMKEFDRSKLYMADLESGLHYILRAELANHHTLEGEKLKTFKDFVTILYKLFPGRPRVMKLLETLQEWLVSMPLDKIPYDAILDLVNNKMRISGIFLTNHTQWVGCRGSKSHLRGYPCSLWKLFHSLTVQAAVKPDALANTAFEADPQAVLQTMRHYIREFFGCRECAKHFEAMTKETVDSVKTLDQAVLWLWRKHNVVNNRLSGAPSEDPKFPKVQWPTSDLCPACHGQMGGMHSWNEDEVLAFLKRYYGNQEISLEFADPRKDLSEAADGNKEPHFNKKPQEDVNKRNPQFLDKLVPKKPEKSLNSKNHQSVSFLGIGFSNIDMSLCVILYLTSSLFLMVMYFFFRFRSKRWKVRYNRPFV